MSDATQEAVAGILSDLGFTEAEEDAAEAQQNAASGPEGTVAPTGQETDFTVDPELPEDVRALVDEPDFYQDARAELEVEPEDEEFEEYADPRLLEERAKRVAAEKKAAYYEGLRAQDGRKAWAVEAEKFFPLSDPASITATSRRGFLREAKAQHEKQKPIVARLLAGERAKLEQERADLQAQLRGDAAAAWGRPTGDRPGTAPPEQAAAAQELEQARQSRDLTGAIKALMKGGRVQI